MIDLKLLEREEPRALTGRTYLEDYRLNLKNRGGDSAQVDELVELNKLRKRCIAEMEKRKAEQNKFGPIIAQKKRNQESAEQELAEMQKLASEVKELEGKAQTADARVQELLQVLPNLCHPSVPVGRSDADNKIVRTVGEPTKLAFKALEHWELGEKLDSIDFERAGRVTGARFAFLKKGVARLERALYNFMLDLHTGRHGYTEIVPT